MTTFLYLGEKTGGRILRYGVGLTDVTDASTTAVLFEAESWDVMPGGEVGDVVFRGVSATVKATNGYSVRITPCLDGTALTPQDFSGSGAGVFACQAFVAERGNRMKATVEQLTRTGDLELMSLEVESRTIRATP